MSDASRRFVHDDPKKIRSKHRRRILSLLSDGEATVSLLSSESGLRMPHVSAEISRMRAEGWLQVTFPLVLEVQESDSLRMVGGL